MTNETENLPASDDDMFANDPPNAYQYQYPDLLLQGLVHAVNEAVPATEIGVTLQVGGRTVSGQLCSFPEYLSAQQRLVDALAADDIPFVEEMRALFVEGEAPAGWVGYPMHVHLVDARVDGQSVSAWRGRLIDVSGWSFGTPGLS